MKLHVKNTVGGLIACDDNDYEIKKKLKIGQIYTVEVKQARNYRFHKKYFALINCAWEYLNERQCDFFKNNVELFRKTVEVEAGHCQPTYSITRKEWLEVPKSISFSSMKEHEFEELYEAVKTVLYSYFLKGITREEFEKELINF